MSVAGIASTFANLIPCAFQGKIQTFKQDFQKLGQDLQSGDLVAAQSDFTKLLKDAPPGLTGLPGSQGGASGKSPIDAAMDKLALDIQSGNLSGVKTDYTSLQQDLQKIAVHHRHVNPAGGSDGDAKQLLAQLGQSLQSGNIANAQQAYAALLQEFNPSNAGGSSSSEASSSGSLHASA